MQTCDGGMTLRPWTEADVETLVREINDEQVQRWTPDHPRPFTDEDAQALLDGNTQPGDLIYAITLDGEIVGGINLIRKSEGDGGIVSYWVASAERGKGIATRALRCLGQMAFDVLDVQQLDLTTDPENVPSQRVAENAGFTRGQVIRNHVEYPEGMRDALPYSLTRSNTP